MGGSGEVVTGGRLAVEGERDAARRRGARREDESLWRSSNPTAALTGLRPASRLFGLSAGCLGLYIPSFKLATGMYHIYVIACPQCSKNHPSHPFNTPRAGRWAMLVLSGVVGIIPCGLIHHTFS